MIIFNTKIGFEVHFSRGLLIGTKISSNRTNIVEQREYKGSVDGKFPN